MATKDDNNINALPTRPSSRQQKKASVSSLANCSPPGHNRNVSRTRAERVCLGRPVCRTSEFVLASFTRAPCASSLRDTAKLISASAPFIRSSFVRVILLSFGLDVAVGKITRGREEGDIMSKYSTQTRLRTLYVTPAATLISLRNTHGDHII